MTPSTAPQPRRAALYARISRDAEGERLGVERQIEDCRALAARLGYEVVQEYVDNDLSASTKSKKVRPEYDAMLATSRAGLVDAIVAYSNSRLTRRVREYLDLIDLVNRGGVEIRTVVSGDHNLATADGRGAALTVAVWDQAEAERTAERTKRAKQQMAEDGGWRGGRRPFGYEKDGVTVREKEAAIVRRLTRDVLAGRSLNALYRELNDQGVKTTSGRDWAAPQLRDVLLRPRNAGLISRGQVGRQGFEIVGPAVWPPLVEEETWRAMFEVLTDPGRKTTTGGEVKWLLSGIARCGIEGCGAPVRATATGQTVARPNHKRVYHYRCRDVAHLQIRQSHTDEYVRTVAVDELRRRKRIGAAMTPTAPDLSPERERRASLERSLARYDRDYEAGDITAVDRRRFRTAAEDEIEQIDARVAEKIQRTTASPIFSAPDPGEAFLAAPVDVQRSVIASLMQIEILSAAAIGMIPGENWTSDRVVITLTEAD